MPAALPPRPPMDARHPLAVRVAGVGVRPRGRHGAGVRPRQAGTAGWRWTRALVVTAAGVLVAALFAAGLAGPASAATGAADYRSGIGIDRSTGTAVTAFCGEPSITRSEYVR